MGLPLDDVAAGSSVCRTAALSTLSGGMRLAHRRGHRALSIRHRVLQGAYSR